MRRIYVGNYIFDPNSKSVLFNSDITKQRQLLVITNITRQIILYNFADPSLGGSFDYNTLTFNYDTSSHSSTDVLQIIYEPEDKVLEDLVYALQELTSRLSFLSGVRGTNSDLRITAPVALPISGTVTATANLGTVTPLPIFSTALGTVPIANNQQSMTAYIGNINRCTA